LGEAHHISVIDQVRWRLAKQSYAGAPRVERHPDITAGSGATSRHSDLGAQKSVREKALAEKSNGCRWFKSTARAGSELPASGVRRVG